MYTPLATTTAIPAIVTQSGNSPSTINPNRVAEMMALYWNGATIEAGAWLKDAISSPCPTRAQTTNPAISGTSGGLGGTQTKGTAKDVRTAPIRTEWASITTAGV